MQGVIEIEGMEFYAYHGCFKEEQIVGNRFVVDLKMETDCAIPSQTDRITDAVNYQIAYQVVKEEMETKSHLLEHVANRILVSLFRKLERIQRATVKVSKMNPPMGGKMDKVSVTLSLNSSDIQ